MNAQKFDVIERVFHGAMKVPAAERATYVAEELADDPELQREVQRLVVAAGQGADFLETDLLAGPVEPQPRGDLVAGRMIGPYRLIRELGRGGMGIVYEAEQRLPHRRVALKVMDTIDAASSKLSGHEPRILGRLNHPAVASIYDADQTPDGRSYFVMELIDGERLDEFAEREQLTRRERLNLFCKVCDAIQHAHTKSVIHLDLKPSNILVTRGTEAHHPELQVKVVDFGVAAIAGSDTTMPARLGETGNVPGTLAYMSPEQRRGDIEAIDIRSDIYSLGVILFKLMTDELPYPVEGLSIPQAWRMLAEQPPRRPRSVDPSLPTDLETIIRTAISEEPARRYQSVAELAGDVRRYLTDMPITARQPSKFYEWTKFAQRNKGLVATLAAVLFGLITTIVGTTAGLVEAQSAQRELDSLARSMKQIAEGLASSASVESTSPVPDERMSLVRLRHAFEVPQRAAERRLIEGDAEGAEAEYALLIKLAQKTGVFPPGYWYVAELQGERGVCLTNMHRFSEAEEVLLHSYEELQSSYGADHPVTARALRRIIQLYLTWGKPAKVEEWTDRLPATPEPAAAPPS